MNFSTPLPIDAVLDRDRDVYDEGLSLERLLVSVEPAKKLRLVILDACRDNPFARTLKRTLTTRAIGRGLAKVEPITPNTLVVFASKAGSMALDGDGGNSPFTSALLDHVTTDGIEVQTMIKRVIGSVQKQTAGRQVPWQLSSLTTEVYLGRQPGQGGRIAPGVGVRGLRPEPVGAADLLVWQTELGRHRAAT